MILVNSPSAHQHILIRGLSLTMPHQFQYSPYGVPSEHALLLHAHGLKVLQRIAWSPSLQTVQPILLLSRVLPGVALVSQGPA